MNKIQLTQEALENNTFDFKARSFIPYQKKEEMAEKLVQATVICDPAGCTYMSYRYDQTRMFLIVKYYTNIDTSEWDTEDGHAALFDYMTRYGDELMSRYEKMCESESFKHDIAIVDNIYSRMYSSLAFKHEHTSTLSYKIGKTFESVLNDQDIVKTLAQSREVSEKMIDMLGVFNANNSDKEKTEKNHKNSVPGLLNFAKK